MLKITKPLLQKALIAGFFSTITIAILTILVIIFSLLGIKKLIYIYQAKDFKNKEELILNESIRVLNECFDLENKNKRTLNKSIELIEYCLEEYGYKN